MDADNSEDENGPDALGCKIVIRITAAQEYYLVDKNMGVGVGTHL